MWTQSLGAKQSIFLPIVPVRPSISVRRNIWTFIGVKLSNTSTEYYFVRLSVRLRMIYDNSYSSEIFLRSLNDILFVSEVMLIKKPLMEAFPIILARSVDVTYIHVSLGQG